jgi:hypothetical protein
MRIFGVSFAVELPNKVLHGPFGTAEAAAEFARAQQENLAGRIRIIPVYSTRDPGPPTERMGR